MVVEMLPVGLRGLVIGGLLAALMSSLSSLFNSSASLFTYDVYQKLLPNTSAKGLVNVGRAATIVVVGLGMLWIKRRPLYLFAIGSGLPRAANHSRVPVGIVQ